MKKTIIASDISGIENSQPVTIDVTIDELPVAFAEAAMSAFGGRNPRALERRTSRS